jgi:transglutaminase-like putative cysteine protease
MKYQVTHKTTYRYSEPVILCQNQAHLRPRNLSKSFRRENSESNRQVCESAQLTVSPVPTSRQNWADFFGNEVTFFSIEESHTELSITAFSVVRVFEPEYPPLGSTPAWEVVRGLLRQGRNPELLAASQFTFDSPQVTRSREAADYAQPSFSADRPVLDAVMDLTSRIFADFKYDKQATSVHTSTAEVFKDRRGVCQDFAHLQITCLRSMGLAARYVSGYLLTDPPPGQPRLIGADASHAWVSVFCPPYGWFEFDPTNNQMPNLRHVTVAWGRDYSDVRPIQGVFLGGGQHGMSVSVDVSPAA